MIDILSIIFSAFTTVLMPFLILFIKRLIKAIETLNYTVRRLELKEVAREQQIHNIEKVVENLEKKTENNTTLIHANQSRILKLQYIK